MPGPASLFRRHTQRRQLLRGAGTLGGAVLGLRLGRPASAAATELRLLNIESQPTSVSFLKALATEYEADTGVRLIVETIVGTTLWTKVTAAIKTGKPYDIINFAHAEQSILLARKDQLVPVTDIINATGLSDFDPKSMMKYKNDFWWLPTELNFCCMYYRKDWLDELKLAVPTTWTEFAHVARAFTDPAKRRFGTSLPYSVGVTPWGNSGFLWANGVKFYDDGWNVLIDTPDMKPRLARSLEFLADINQYNAPGQFSMTFLNMMTNFISGTAGIVAESGGLIQEIEAKAPDLADKFVVAPYPAPDGGKGTVTYGDKGFAVGKTPNSKWALDFLSWFMKTGKLVAFQSTLPMALQPAQYSTYKNPDWLNNPTVKKYWSSMETMRTFLDPAKVNTDAIQLQGGALTVNQGLLLNSEVILDMYQNALTKKMTVSAAIDDCAAKMRKFTKKDV